MYAATVTHRLWLWPVKFALATLERTVASEVGIPDLSHISVGRSRVEQSPDSSEPRNGSCSSYHKQHCAFALETPFFFYNNRSDTRGWYIMINDSNGKLMRFFFVFKFLHVFIGNRFEYTLIIFNVMHLDSSHCITNCLYIFPSSVRYHSLH
jgi:hypothetical protein